MADSSLSMNTPHNRVDLERVKVIKDADRMLDASIEYMPFVNEVGYLDLLRAARDMGVRNATSRTRQMVSSMLTPTLGFDLRQGFPLLTTKSMQLGVVAAGFCGF